MKPNIIHKTQIQKNKIIKRWTKIYQANAKEARVAIPKSDKIDFQGEIIGKESELKPKKHNKIFYTLLRSLNMQSMGRINLMDKNQTCTLKTGQTEVTWEAEDAIRVGKGTNTA